VSRLFKEVTGKGFKDYVVEKRLEYGHALLMTTQKSIVEIAAESGFESSSYFSIVFKQKYGVPPTKYRSIQKESQSLLP
jgi:AraC-like DNA-binding protein